MCSNKDMRYCVLVCACVCCVCARTVNLTHIAHDCTVTLALVFATCQPAVNLFDQSVQGTEPLWGISLDPESECNHSANKGITEHQVIITRVWNNIIFFFQLFVLCQLKTRIKKCCCYCLFNVYFNISGIWEGLHICCCTELDSI